MSNYLSVFLAPRMLAGLVVVFLVSAAVTWLRRGGHPGVLRRLGLFGFVTGVGAVLLATLLREPPVGSCPACLADWQLDKLVTGAVGTDVALNVALFVAPVLLATLLWRTPVRATLIAVAGSLVIEVAQPLLGIGANDAIDLLANTAGAVIGALAGAIILLLGDALARRRVGRARVLRVAGGVLVVVALLIGYPAWTADSRRATAAAQLDELFAGTTLADYQANRDGVWDDKVAAFAETNGPLTAMAYRTDQVARERFSWNVYFATRCIIAEWTPTGFTTIEQSGSDCIIDFHP